MVSTFQLTRPVKLSLAHPNEPNVKMGKTPKALVMLQCLAGAGCQEFGGRLRVRIGKSAWFLSGEGAAPAEPEGRTARREPRPPRPTFQQRFLF